MEIKYSETRRSLTYIHYGYILPLFAVSVDKRHNGIDASVFLFGSSVVYHIKKPLSSN